MHQTFRFDEQAGGHIVHNTVFFDDVARWESGQSSGPYRPILCQPGVTLVSEAEFQYLLLGADQAAELRSRIPAFRFFWEETLGLALPNRVRF